MSIRGKILFWFLLPTILIGIITAGTVYYSIRKTVEQNIFDQLIIASDELQERVRVYLQGKKGRIIDFGSDGFVRDCAEKIINEIDVDSYTGLLNQHLLNNKKPLDLDLLEVFIVDPRGKVIGTSEISRIGQNISGEIYFAETMRRGSFISDLHYSPEFKQNTIEVAKLLFSREGNKLIGMIFNRYRGDSFKIITHSGFSEEFRELMKEEGLGKTGELYIINNDKLMITESRFIKNTILKQVVETEGVQNTLDNRTGMIGLYMNYRGVSVLGVSRYFEEMEWVILAEKDASEAFAPIRRLRNITIIIGTIGIMFIITIAIFLAKGITKPIKRLIDGTRRIASGDLEHPITISKRKDELKGLAESFNLMMSKLRESKEKNDQLFLEVKRGRDEWQRTFDAITDGLSIHGSDHTVRKLNLAMQDMLNVTHEQAVTMKCNELIYERVNPLDICPFNKKGENIRSDSMEVTIDRLGKTFLVSTYPILDSCGKLIGCVHSMKNITEQKKMEKQKECINNINKIIATSLDIRDVYEGVNNEIGKHIDFDHMGITLVDEKDYMIDVFAVTKDKKFTHMNGTRQNDVGLVTGRAKIQRDKQFPKKGSATREVIAACAPIITCDTAEGIFSTDDKLFKEGIRSHLNFPLVYKGKAIGAIIFGSRIVNNYSSDQFDLLRQTAPQLTIAIINTRLYLNTKKSEEDIRKYSQDLEKTNRELVDIHKDVARHRKELQLLSERIVLIQEEERKNLSRELHDQTGQALVALKTNLGIIDQLLPEYAHDARHRLRKSKQLLDKTMEEVRSLSFRLRPPMLDDLGLVPTIRSYSRDFTARTKIAVNLISNIKDKRLQSDLALSLYRMVQEALTNVVKHSDAKTVQINVYHEDSELILSIKDDGKGFDIEKIRQDGVNEHGVGLLGMRERFTSIGAEFQILSKEGEGTKLTARCQVKT